MSSEIGWYEAELGIKRSEVPTHLLRDYTEDEVQLIDQLTQTLAQTKQEYDEKLTDNKLKQKDLSTSSEYKEYLQLTTGAKSDKADADGIAYTPHQSELIRNVKTNVIELEEAKKKIVKRYDKLTSSLTKQIQDQKKWNSDIRYLDYLKAEKARREEEIKKQKASQQPKQPHLVTTTSVTTVPLYVSTASPSPIPAGTTSGTSGSGSITAPTTAVSTPIPSVGPPSSPTSGNPTLIDPLYPDDPDRQVECLKAIREVDWTQAQLGALKDEYEHLVVKYKEDPDLGKFGLINEVWGAYTNQLRRVKELREDYRLHFPDEVRRIPKPLVDLDQDRTLIRLLRLGSPDPIDSDDSSQNNNQIPDHTQDPDSDEEDMASRYVMKDLPRFSGDPKEDPEDHTRDFETFMTDVYKVDFRTTDTLGEQRWDLVFDVFAKSLKAKGWDWFADSPYEKLLQANAVCTHEKYKEMVEKFHRDFNLVGTTMVEQQVELQHLKWIPTKLSFDDFIRKFRKLMRLVNYTEKGQVCALALAMPQNLFSMVAASHTLQDAIAAAREGIAVFMSPTQVNVAAPGNGTPAPFMPMMDPYGQPQQQKPIIDVNELAQAMGDVMGQYQPRFGGNFRGRGGGFNGRGRGRGRGQPGRGGGNPPGRGLLCDFCQKPGHFLAKCNQLKEVCKNRGLMVIRPNRGRGRGRGGQNPPARDQASAATEYDNPVAEFTNQNQLNRS